MRIARRMIPTHSWTVAVLACTMFQPSAYAQRASRDAAISLGRLNADLLADTSATAVLARWCAERRLAEPARIRAVVDRATTVPPTPEQRTRLQVGANAPVAYRRVRLMCGAHLLSEAENWYVPGRLTPEMNAALGGDAPFGAVIRPLHPNRRTLAVETLWGGEGDVPQQLLRHSALVLDGNGQPLAEVRETYQHDLIAD